MRQARSNRRRRAREGSALASVSGSRDEVRPGRGELRESCVTRARWLVHRSHRGRHHTDVESEAERIECRLAHAVVGGNADHHHPFDAPPTQQRLQFRRGGAARCWVTNTEGRVTVLSPGALAYYLTLQRESWLELRSPAPRDAVDRPPTAARDEVRSLRRMPVLRVDDERTRLPGVADLGVGGFDESVGARNEERAGRVDEVILEVHHDQGCLRIISNRHHVSADDMAQRRAAAIPLWSITRTSRFLIIEARDGLALHSLALSVANGGVRCSRALPLLRPTAVVGLHIDGCLAVGMLTASSLNWTELARRGALRRRALSGRRVGPPAALNHPGFLGGAPGASPNRDTGSTFVRPRSELTVGESPSVDEVVNDLEVANVLGEEGHSFNARGGRDGEVELTPSRVATTTGHRGGELTPDTRDVDAHRQGVERRLDR